MKFAKTILAFGSALIALALTSCGCCTGEAPVPPLRPLPAFSEVAPAPVQEVPIHYGK